MTPPCVVPTFRPYAAENLEFGGFYASSCESRARRERLLSVVGANASSCPITDLAGGLKGAVELGVVCRPEVAAIPNLDPLKTVGAIEQDRALVRELASPFGKPARLRAPAG